MTTLTHILEPSALLMTWQSMDEAASDRMRRSVARIDLGEGRAEFRYLPDTTDFEAARSSGFKGYPAFARTSEVVTTGVAEALAKRLPPRSRGDFDRFLAQYGLPSPFPLSDLALLGYTGGKLPSDGFAFVPVFGPEALPCELIVEVAGMRHVFDGDPSSIRPGDHVAFTVEPANLHDPDAVSVHWRGAKLGYANRALRSSFAQWLQTRQVSARVQRVNGRPDRPVVYLHVRIDRAGSGPEPSLVMPTETASSE